MQMLESQSKKLVYTAQEHLVLLCQTGACTAGAIILRLRGFCYRGRQQEQGEEMTAAVYTAIGNASRATMLSFTARMRIGSARSLWRVSTVEGGSCSDKQYKDEFNDRAADIQIALGAHGYQAPTLPVIIGICGSHVDTTTHAL